MGVAMLNFQQICCILLITALMLQYLYRLCAILVIIAAAILYRHMDSLNTTSVLSDTRTVSETTSEITVRVQTDSGVVEGRRCTTKNGDVWEFHNIPYAIPPVGKLRFQPSVRYDSTTPWSTPIDGTRERVIKCPQPSMVNGTVIGTEDCLYLTIRSTHIPRGVPRDVPRDAPRDPDPKPVIVWIHGGRFIQRHCCLPGYSFDSELTSELDMVTVNINHRLGFLGFSSIRELWGEGVFANNGIRDQITALQWIRDNISRFGGDPNRITVVGQSSGGTSALALLSSPLAVGLFQRALVVSPGPEQRFDHVQGDKFQREIWKVLEASECDGKEDMRQCLLDVPPRYLIQREGVEGVEGRGLLSPSRLAFYRFPRSQGEAQDIGGYIVTDPHVFPRPAKDIKHNNFYKDPKIKVLISNTAQETYLQVLKTPSLRIKTYEELNNTLTPLLPNISPDKTLLNKLYRIYGHLTPQFFWDTFVSDMRSTCPCNDLAADMSESTHHDVYRLFIDYNIKNGTGSGLPAYHVFDIDVIFGDKRLDKKSWSEKDWEFRDMLVGVWRDFASGKDGWGTFPEKTLVLGNGKEIWDETENMPHEKWCEELRKMDLTKYGLQN